MEVDYQGLQGKWAQLLTIVFWELKFLILRLLAPFVMLLLLTNFLFRSEYVMLSLSSSSSVPILTLNEYSSIGVKAILDELVDSCLSFSASLPL